MPIHAFGQVSEGIVRNIYPSALNLTFRVWFKTWNRNNIYYSAGYIHTYNPTVPQATAHSSQAVQYIAREFLPQCKALEASYIRVLVFYTIVA